jgi:hypothetical protein
METQEKTHSVFETGPPQPFIDRGPQLPEHYGDDKLVAMVRDPLYVFLYWELEGTLGRQALSSSLVSGQAESWTIKVFCLSDNTSDFVAVQVWARNWYLQVSPGKRYRFELGYFGSDGNFNPVVSSGEVETPRAGPSEDLSLVWAHFFKGFSRGRLVKGRRKAPSKPKRIDFPVPGLTPEILSPPASPELQRKEYIFRP